MSSWQRAYDYGYKKGHEDCCSGAGVACDFFFRGLDDFVNEVADAAAENLAILSQEEAGEYHTMKQGYRDGYRDASNEDADPQDGDDNGDGDYN
jgi:hypothetical protein